MNAVMLAQEELRDHYKFPRNKKRVEAATFSEELYNPSCGDRITMSGCVKNGVLADVGFQGTGCMLSQAAASMLTERVLGEAIAQIACLSEEEIIAHIGLELGPTRRRCATLALEVLKRALAV